MLRVPKRGEGKHTSGGQVFVQAAGMLAVPIRLQYRHKQHLNITCSKMQVSSF